jgi:hypothetical protein
MPSVPERRVGPPLTGATEVEVDGRVSVFSPLTRQVMMLNDTASDVWRLADGEHDLDEVTTLLATAYSVEVEDISDDVRATVQRFVDAGLLPPSTLDDM